MQTFDQSLMQLYKESKVTLETAMQASSNPHEFMLRVKGIQASSDNTWQRFENSAPGDAKPALSRS
jgi:twitching motility protein PilT